MRLVLCANITCKRGEGGTRNVFHTRQETAQCCCKACQNTHWQRSKGWRYNAPVDLPSAQIDAALARMAAQRRATRSWLRIEDPWQQKAGSELHKSAIITHSIEDGAFL
jgi:hypothetical protein